MANGKKAAAKVERAMHERKHGTLKSGRSGKKVTSRKQAIALACPRRAPPAEGPEQAQQEDHQEALSRLDARCVRLTTSQKQIHCTVHIRWWAPAG
jgi:hypothetical protein